MPRRKQASVVKVRKHTKNADGRRHSDIQLPPRKKIRHGASQESLKELARHAIRAMQERGVWRATTRVKVIDRPLSPGSFLKRVGLGDLHDVVRRRPPIPLLHPATNEKGSDEGASKLTDASTVTAPDSPPTLETLTYRSPTGNITPATARAALGLLDLRR